MESDWQTPATKPLGAVEIPRREHLQRLSAAVAMKYSANISL
jgi:Leu/Phe-tRNA-protein transferase